MYSRGFGGLKRDMATAYFWLKLSTDQGEATAEHLLRYLETTMSPTELAEGKRLAEAFRAKNSHPAATEESRH
jgi:TPR repeat protein